MSQIQDSHGLFPYMIENQICVIVLGFVMNVKLELMSNVYSCLMHQSYMHVLKITPIDSLVNNI